MANGDLIRCWYANPFLFWPNGLSTRASWAAPRQTCIVKGYINVDFMESTAEAAHLRGSRRFRLVNDRIKS